MVDVRPTKYYGVYRVNGKLATKSMIQGFRIHEEKIIRKGKEEYRIWEPSRSKLAAALKKGLKTWPFKEGTKVLYLGAASGVTVSYISDIVGNRGKIYAVEFSPVSMRDLVLKCEVRENIWPILEDARFPERYPIDEKVDVLFEDVAQPDQDRILTVNAQKHLKKGGIAMIAVKSQSIDVRKKPKEIYEEVKNRLKKHFDIIESFKLDPYEKHHLFIVLRYRG